MMNINMISPPRQLTEEEKNEYIAKTRNKLNLNHQSIVIINLAKEVVSDESVFSQDQISLLTGMIDLMAKVIEKEFYVNKGSSNYSSHGF